MIRSPTTLLLFSLLCCLMVPASSLAWNRALGEITAPGRSDVWTNAVPRGESGGEAAGDSSQVTGSGTASGILAAPGPGREPEVTEPAAGSSGYRFPSAGEQLESWTLNAIGPSALAGGFAGAAWGHWVLNEPPEWRSDGEGFVKRLGSGMAANVISETTLSLFSAAMRQDAGYYRCPCTGFGRRVVHAIKMTVVARGRDGNAVFSPAKVVSPFVGPMATRTTLYPERYTYGDGALSGAYGLLINAGLNFAREFILKAPRW